MKSANIVYFIAGFLFGTAMVGGALQGAPWGFLIVPALGAIVGAVAMDNVEP